MDMAQPAFDKLCLLIQGSNDKIAIFVGLMRDRYVAHANADRPAYGTAARYRFDLEVADVLEENGQIIEALKSTSIWPYSRPVPTAGSCSSSKMN